MTPGTHSRRSAILAALVLGLTLGAATVAAPAASEQQVAAGRLNFQVKLRQSGPFLLPCPTEASACIPRTGTGSVRGLGRVSVTYTWYLGVGPPTCPTDFAKPIATYGRLSVAGKGTIIFGFAEGARCMRFDFLDYGRADWLYEPQEFTIIRGTGRFVAASGRGKREVLRSPVPSPDTETWTGTLEVPGLAFDVTAPKLHGAGSKTVRAQKGAKSAPVTFKVTATDRIDRVLPVSCQPRSGSRFKIGKTTVNCSATDSSANTAKEAFTVTVKRRQ